MNEIERLVRTEIMNLCSSLDEIKQLKTRFIADGIRVLAPYCKEEAIDLFNYINNENNERIDNISYLLLAAKSIGNTNKNVEKLINKLKEKELCGAWGREIWINALTLRALGVFGISYPQLKENIMLERRANGSWFDKIWVTSYAVIALYYNNVEWEEIKKSVKFLKSHIYDGHWEEKSDPHISSIFVTSITLEALLLLGEGYREKYIREAVNWCTEELTKTNDIKDKILLLIPLVYISTGQAIEESHYEIPNTAKQLFGEMISEVKSEIQRAIDPIQYISLQLKSKYTKENFLQLLESFKIVLRIRDMCEREIKKEDLLNQLESLRNYSKGNNNIVTFIDNFSKLIMSTQFEYVDEAWRTRAQKLGEILYEQWIAEFLQKESRQD